VGFGSQIDFEQVHDRASCLGCSHRSADGIPEL